MASIALLLGCFAAEAWLRRVLLVLVVRLLVGLVVEEAELANGLETRQAADAAPLQWRQQRLDIGVDGAPGGGGAAGVGVGYERVSPFGRRRRDSERRQLGGQGGGAWQVHERRRAQRFGGIGLQARGQVGGRRRERRQGRAGGRELRVSLCVRSMHPDVAGPIELGGKTVDVVDAPVVPAL
jgi:hypothetical protein